MITIVSGTNRKNSNSLKVAKHYQKILDGLEQKTNLLDLNKLPTEFLFTDMYGKRSKAFEAIEQQLIESKKFIFILAEYNGSYPGAVKLLIDCLDRAAWTGKHAALVGIASGEFGNLRGVDHFTGVLHYVRTFVLPHKVYLFKIDSKIDESGHITDSRSLNEIQKQCSQFIDFI